MAHADPAVPAQPSGAYLDYLRAEVPIRRELASELVRDGKQKMRDILDISKQHGDEIYRDPESRRLFLGTLYYSRPQLHYGAVISPSLVMDSTSRPCSDAESPKSTKTGVPHSSAPKVASDEVKQAEGTTGTAKIDQNTDTACLASLAFDFGRKSMTIKRVDEIKLAEQMTTAALHVLKQAVSEGTADRTTQT
ncbi:hypothetical protein EPUS_07265 [Endocarpon pusillum Z07020]|uniref:Uncharacterized protein n=1 Tax=Endocarpon pusillum (strain Z07020 / HMAS-L-300199) TaxID=1263415 RepID=U1G9U7_ENDPU|nr:uncharacterized protein EPUS_07265 [Endocarpon pusillum Z07020]ERF68778.1 hypothetical protein EPUS_07265 [Endocarpon pusillum Z07020]